MTEDLPLGWTTTSVREVANLIRGVTFKKSESSPIHADGLVPIIRAGNVSGGGLRLDDDLVFVPEERVAEEQLLRRGDIVIATSSGSAAVVGKSALVRENWRGAHGAFMAVLRPNGHVDSVFLAYCLQEESVRNLWREAAAGTNINNLKRDDLLSTEVPLCPIPEQRRIVAAVEEHFSRLDAVESALDEAERRCQALVKSVLLSVVPTDLPVGWQLSTVADAGTTGLGRQRSPKFHSGPNMKPYLRVANVFEDQIDTSDVMEMHFDEDDFEKYRLRSGDVLLNEGQSPEWLGRPAIYRGDPPEVAFTNSLIRFIPGSEVTSEWALLVFRRHMHAGRFMKESRITTNIAHLALGRFRTVEFPIPSREVQDELVASTQEMLDAVDLQANQIKRARAKSHLMRRAILSAAFAGDLIHQAPNDEPASALLERIATSRHTVESNI